MELKWGDEYFIYPGFEAGGGSFIVSWMEMIVRLCSFWHLSLAKARIDGVGG